MATATRLRRQRQRQRNCKTVQSHCEVAATLQAVQYACQLPVVTLLSQQFSDMRGNTASRTILDCMRGNKSTLTTAIYSAHRTNLAGSMCRCVFDDVEKLRNNKPTLTLLEIFSAMVGAMTVNNLLQVLIPFRIPRPPQQAPRATLSC